MLASAIGKYSKTARLTVGGLFLFGLLLASSAPARADDQPAGSPSGVHFADDAAMPDGAGGARQVGAKSSGAAPADAMSPLLPADAPDGSSAPKPLTNADGTALPVPIGTDTIDGGLRPVPANASPSSPAAPAPSVSVPTISPPTVSRPAVTAPSVAAGPKQAVPSVSAPATSPAAAVHAPRALEPIPESKYAGPADIEVTSFHGITPGMTSRDAVQKAWGKPKESRSQGTTTTDLFSVDPFPRVEVNCVDSKVASLIIRFEHGYPASQVAEQLDLVKVQPVLVSNDLGSILGQAYPERGVLFAFEVADDPTKALKKVTHIILEPISAEPFVLRAETNIDIRPEFALHDADQAIKLQSGNARAHWLRSRALTLLGQYQAAMEAANKAVKFDPKEARFQLTKAQAIAQQGSVSEAMAEADKAVALSAARPHIRAKAICLMGDLYGSAKKPDYKQAYKLHSQAIQIAAPLASSKHPALRLAAKETLLDAHLGAARDIAWGEWREKEKAVSNWLDKSAKLAGDLTQNEHGSEEYRFRVYVRSLGIILGMQGKVDPSRWSQEAVRSGEDLIASSPEAARKSQVEWEIAVALYDALQVFQMRNDQEGTLKCGEQAIDYLTRSGRQSQPGSAPYLLGRMYFRMGAVYAINREDHKGAVEWFEKAVPMLGKEPPQEAMTDLARLGDTFVSMGVSYWKTGYRKKALALTQHGASLMEESVRRGTHDRNVLIVPYSNLAAMNREMGNAQDAQRMEQMATRIKGTTLK